MPITAKLSRKFYEKLGDEVTNELVTWLNAVDESYRQEFRELFEAHFGRLDQRIDTLEKQLGVEMKALEDRLHSKLANQKTELLFWMFLFWIGTIGILKL